MELSNNDILELQVAAGYGDGPVTISRKSFDAFIHLYEEIESLRAERDRLKNKVAKIEEMYNVEGM